MISYIEKSVSVRVTITIAFINCVDTLSFMCNTYTQLNRKLMVLCKIENVYCQNSEASIVTYNSVAKTIIAKTNF